MSLGNKSAKQMQAVKIKMLEVTDSNMQPTGDDSIGSLELLPLWLYSLSNLVSTYPTRALRLKYHR